MEEGEYKEDESILSMKKVSVDAYELDLRSEMNIDYVFNAEDLIPYHRPSDDSTLSSSSLPSSPLSTYLIQPVYVRSLLVPRAPLVFSQQTTKVIGDVLYERVVSIDKGDINSFWSSGVAKLLVICIGISVEEFHRLDSNPYKVL